MRDGQKVTIYDGGMATLTGRLGTLTIRTRNEWIDFARDANGDGQVSYNRKDTVRLAAFYHYEAHDGFALNRVAQRRFAGGLAIDSHQIHSGKAESPAGFNRRGLGKGFGF